MSDTLRAISERQNLSSDSHARLQCLQLLERETFAFACIEMARAARHLASHLHGGGIWAFSHTGSNLHGCKGFPGRDKGYVHGYCSNLLK